MSFALALLGLLVAAVALVVSIRTARRIDDTNRKQLRAYIAIEPAFVGSFDATTAAQIKFRVWNRGATPAKNVRRAILVRPLSDPPVAPDDAFEMDTGEGVGLTVASQDSREFDGPLSDTPLGRKQRLCAFIRVTYEDIFGEAHVEEMGFYVSGDDDTLKKVGTGSAPSAIALEFIHIDAFGTST